MAKLPDDTALGGNGSSASGRPIASYDGTAIGQGMRAAAKSEEAGAQAIAGGVSDLGKGIQQAGVGVGGYFKHQQSETDTLNVAKAESQYLIDTKKLHNNLADEQDNPDKLSEKYDPLFQQARDNAATLITNPQQRELFTLKRAPDVETSILAVKDRAFNISKDKEIAGANEKLEQIRQSALQTNDPTKRAEFIDAGHGLIAGLKDAGYIGDQQAQKLRTNWTQNYAVSAVSVLPPDQQINMLRESPQGKDAVLDRIGGIENATGNPAAKNPNTSAMGNFQFTNQTWLDTIKAHRPDLLQGRDEKTVLDLRADPKLSREMAGYLTDDNAASLRASGVAPNPSNLYLAHFLGASTAAAVLKAPPGTPIADVVSADAIANNRSVLAGKTTDSVVAWSDQKMGGTPRGKGGLIDFIPEDKRLELLQGAQSTLLGQTRKQDSEAALEQYNTKNKLSDDIASARATGVGLTDLNLNEVRRVLGSKAAQEWQDNRTDAHAAWVVTHDMASLNDQQIDQRLGSITPKAGEADFSRKQAVFEEAQKTAQTVRKARVEDPAGSVSEDPSVKPLLGSMDVKHPETFKPIIAARYAAQERAGIPEDAQSPITKQEALALTSPLRQMLPGQERTTLMAMGKNFQELFGDNADSAFAYALRVHKVDAATAQTAARVMKKLGLGELPDTTEAGTSDRTAEIGAADKAVGGQMTLSAANNVPGYGMGPMGVPKKIEASAGANIPLKAIKDLRGDPQLAGDFDQKYGKGSAKKILENYPLQPGKKGRTLSDLILGN